MDGVTASHRSATRRMESTILSCSSCSGSSSFPSATSNHLWRMAYYHWTFLSEIPKKKSWCVSLANCKTKKCLVTWLITSLVCQEPPATFICLLPLWRISLAPSRSSTKVDILFNRLPQICIDRIYCGDVVPFCA